VAAAAHVDLQLGAFGAEAVAGGGCGAARVGDALVELQHRALGPLDVLADQRAARDTHTMAATTASNKRQSGDSQAARTSRRWQRC
jgi:hypothetical protein